MTDERPYSIPSGGYENHPYTIAVLDYQQQGNILIAREVKATWNLPDGDFTYWRGVVKEIKFMLAK